MKILLVNIDSKIPNLALMKISAYYKEKGHDVGFNVQNPDKIFVSCIFKKNREQALGLKHFYPRSEMVFGGSGINYDVLPDEIETMKPDYDLYPSTYSQGYTTRGCIKNCPWCIVHEKEGKYRRFQRVDEFHDSRFDTVMIMDNNWLADKEWFFGNTGIILDDGLKVIEHGMDIKLLDKDIAERLSEIRFAKPMKFAFDQISDEPYILKGLEMLKNAGINLKQHVMFYVLTGFNTTHKEDLYRCNLLKKNGTNPFVMRYKSNDIFINRLAKWANRKHAFWSSTFEEFEKGYWKKSILSN